MWCVTTFFWKQNRQPGMKKQNRLGLPRRCPRECRQICRGQMDETTSFCVCHKILFSTNPNFPTDFVQCPFASAKRRNLWTNTHRFYCCDKVLCISICYITCHNSRPCRIGGPQLRLTCHRVFNHWKIINSTWINLPLKTGLQWLIKTDKNLDTSYKTVHTYIYIYIRCKWYLDEWTASAQKHATDFVVMAARQVCVPGNLLSRHPYTCIFQIVRFAYIYVYMLTDIITDPRWS